jgi:hypothetical protein
MGKLASKISIICGFFICLLSLDSCHDQSEAKSGTSELEIAIYEYIKDINDKFSGKRFIIRVRKEVLSSQGQISQIYRFAAENAYLPENIQPDSTGSIADKPVIFFSDKRLGSQERRQIKQELEALNLINSTKAYNTKSNYEERIIFLDSGSKFVVLKDTKYVNIEEVAKLILDR